MKLYKVNESQKDFFINSQPNLKSVENIDSINLLAKNLAQSEISPQKQTENKNNDLKNENFHIIPQQQKLFFQSSDNQQINNSISNLNQSNNIFNSNNQNDNENEKSQQEKQNDNQKINSTKIKVY
ncbi:hypothetical protein PPERSA_12199 [Pseudocohnilembus persalinus]|uniref:Uncharacterized protein n=1 Tax=Pseudocohnilembus persalinus TaxID=266149 RepID=A0A0V0R8Z4_PSEPJ|nr:hypothetical protein PPERSA_12199 [Pseudocohnilembus persalinus]|eukprot:KRX10848.1 hypothetical protein PPERSA_12199 [Pseudocohnilembus persalinus]